MEVTVDAGLVSVVGTVFRHETRRPLYPPRGRACADYAAALAASWRLRLSSN